MPYFYGGFIGSSIRMGSGLGCGMAAMDIVILWVFSYFLLHHHIDFLHFLTNFKISDFNKEHTSCLKMI